MCTLDALLNRVVPYEGIASVSREDVNILETISIRRAERALGYFCISGAGFFLMLSPSRIVGENVSHWVELSWSLSMCISGAVCFYGASTDKWIGEFTGIPLLSSVAFLYAASAAISSWGNSLTLFGFSCILAAYGWALVGRWKDVKAIKRQAEALGCSGKEE